MSNMIVENPVVPPVSTPVVPPVVQSEENKTKEIAELEREIKKKQEKLNTMKPKGMWPFSGGKKSKKGGKKSKKGSKKGGKKSKKSVKRR